MTKHTPSDLRALAELAQQQGERMCLDPADVIGLVEDLGAAILGMSLASKRVGRLLGLLGRVTKELGQFDYESEAYAEACAELGDEGDHG